jgi:hypothetical protein
MVDPVANVDYLGDTFVANCERRRRRCAPQDYGPVDITGRRGDGLDDGIEA